MQERSRTSKELEWFTKRTTPVFAFFAAVAALVELAGGPTWALIACASLAIAGPVVDWLLKGRQQEAEVREERSALWLEPPALVSELAATAGFYRLGVETEAREALDAAGLGDREHSAYVERDIDAVSLRPALRTAATTDGPSFIVVSGPSKAGKSRTLLEAAAATVADAWLIAPADAAALGKLARGKPPPEIASDRCVIWLDDIEPFVRPGDQGLSTHTLRALEDWNRPVLILGTAGGKGRLIAGPDAKRFADPISDLLTAHPPIELSSEQSVAERARMGVEYSPESIRRIASDGIGEYMIVAQRLRDRLSRSGDCPEGVAVARAAIDWRRVGLLRPASRECLQRLFPAYLNGPVTSERFEQGLLWATAPLYSHVALLQGNDPFEPYDYVVEQTRLAGPSVPASTWEAVLEDYATDQELTQVGISAFFAGEYGFAEVAFRRADERGTTSAPSTSASCSGAVAMRRARRMPIGAPMKVAPALAPSTSPMFLRSGAMRRLQRPRIAAPTSEESASRLPLSESFSRSVARQRRLRPPIAALTSGGTAAVRPTWGRCSWIWVMRRALRPLSVAPTSAGTA